ncbi:MAG: hypothetical protein M3Y57_11980 [Acidobacteriota bacterium]|nr:hypothetical protein [Acidobacteriota bacterium]
MSACDTALLRLYDQSITFRLYADHANGMSVPELSMLCSRSERWVQERIEATRLCLEKQVRIDLPPEPRECPDSLWQTQVWD